MLTDPPTAHATSLAATTAAVGNGLDSGRARASAGDEPRTPVPVAQLYRPPEQAGPAFAAEHARDHGVGRTVDIRG